VAPPDAGSMGGSPDGGTEAGMVAQCNSYLDCPVPDAGNHPEVACDVDTHTCRQLTTDSCAYVIGDYTGLRGPMQSADPIFIGAFATIPPSAPESHTSFLNYKLAQGDFSKGIQAGGGSALRTPVIVVCDDSADPIASMNHLIQDVNIAAVIAPLPSATLASTFSAVNLAGGSNIFFMNPFGADSTLTSLPTHELLWHMLGQPSDMASAYAAFFPRVEAYVRATQNIPAGTPMKVATITATSPTVTLDLRAAVDNVLTWNGGPAVSTNPNYLDISIPQSYLTNDDLTKIDYATPASELTAFAPNVVVSFASEEMIKLLTYYEASGSQRPFYLLSPYNIGTSSLTAWLNGLETRRKRLAGIGFAADVGNPVLATYDAHFLSVFTNGQSELGGENYYDAVYYTMYSLIAAGRTTSLTGTRVAEGMPRLVNPLGTPEDVGQMAIGDVTQQLVSLSGTTIDLRGTLGPPNFSLTTGARISEGSVYCISQDQSAPDGGVPTLAYSYTRDVLTLSDSADGGTPTLQGTFSCYSGM
jgi:hypothetical protein